MLVLESLSVTWTDPTRCDITCIEGQESEYFQS